jgi:hypothetical protein
MSTRLVWYDVQQWFLVTHFWLSIVSSKINWRKTIFGLGMSLESTVKETSGAFERSHEKSKDDIDIFKVPSTHLSSPE